MASKSSTYNPADNYFVVVPHWVLYSGVSSNAIRLYGCIRAYADRGLRGFPSRRSLAEDMNVSSRSTVDLALKELIDKGIVEKIHRKRSNGSFTSSAYLLVSNAPAGWKPKEFNLSEGENLLEDDEEVNTEAPLDRPADHPLTDQPTTLDRYDGLPLTDTSVTHKKNQLTRSNEIDPVKDYLPESVSLGSPKALELATFLADRIEANRVKRPTVTVEWKRSIDRMMRLDGRTEEQIRAAIIWATSHDFWSQNILSPDKLRKHYDRLSLQARSENTKAKPKGAAALESLSRPERVAIQ
jgi:hypothetical protein